METIIAAVITGVITLVGVLIANSKTQAVTETKLDELTREVREHTYWVYKHTFPNGKVYIGITMQYPCTRWKHGKGYSYNKHFDRAVKKYGWDNVEHEILENFLTKEEACEAERFYIQKFNSCNPLFGYNNSTGGDHGGTGCIQSEATRAKRSASMRGKFAGKYVGGKSKKAKAVSQYTKDGKYIATYEATTDAQRDTGINYTNIVKCCTHNQRTAGGYIWIYAGDEDSLPDAIQRCCQKSYPSEETKQKTSASMKKYWANKRGRKWELKQSSLRCCH